MHNFFNKFAWATLAFSLTAAWVSALGILWVLCNTRDWEPGLPVIAALVCVGVFFLAVKSFLLSLLMGFLSWCSNGSEW